MKDVVKAVAYADLFDMALTPQEIALAMPGRPVPLPAVFDAVAFDADRLSMTGGFVTLRGREELVANRHRRYALAEDKFRRAVRFFRFARFLPFLRAAFVCNTLAKSNARDESDIDIFAVAAPGRLWTCRLLVTGLAALFGVRRHGEDVSDHLCLSFFVSEEALDLSPLAIENDIYLAHWLHELYPLYDESGVGRRLMAENAWARAMRPASLEPMPSRRRSIAPAPSVWKRFIEAIVGARIEAFAKRIQTRSIEEKWKKQDTRSSGVVVSDTILKFHENDRRAEFRDRYRNAIAHHEERAFQPA